MKKVISTFLLVSVLFISFVSCSSKNNNNKGPVIESDEIFYKAEEHTVYIPGDNIELTELGDVVVGDNSIIVTMNYSEKSEEGSDSNFYNVRSTTYICLTESNSVIEVNSDMLPIKADYTECASVISKSSTEVEALYLMMDMKTYEAEFHWYEIDLVTGTLGDEIFYDEVVAELGYIPIAYQADSDGNLYFLTEDRIVLADSEGHVRGIIDDPRLDERLVTKNGSVYVLFNDGSLNRIVFDDRTIVDDDKTSSNTQKVKSLNGESYSVSNNRLLDANGNEVFDWNSTDANLSHYAFDNYYIVNSENEIYVLGTTELVNLVSIYFCKLTKDNTNPNAGKKLLYVAGQELENDLPLLDAIYKYNMLSDDTYIKINSYQLSDYDSNLKTISSQLLADVKDCNKSDIVMNINDSVYEKDEILLNIYDDIFNAEGLNINKNVMNAFVTNEALYVVPITYEVEGYLDYPLTSEMTKTDWFNCLFGQYYGDLFDENGECNSDVLKELLIRCNELGFDELLEIEDDNVYVESTQVINSFQTVSCYLNFLNGCAEIGKGYKITSLRQNGELGIKPIVSVAINANTSYKEEALVFLKDLLMMSHQSLRADCSESSMASQDYSLGGIPINNIAVDNEVSRIENLSKNSFEYIYYIEMDSNSETKQSYIDLLGNTFYRVYTDYEALYIVYENSQSYFCGQKSLDDVVAIISNQLGTLISTRE